MIGTEDRARISQAIYTSDLDYFHWSGILGEPFIDEHIMFFYDGTTISLVGYPADRNLSREDLHKHIALVMSRILDTMAPQFINYFGPIPTDPSLLLRMHYELIYATDPDPHNVDVALDLTHPSLLRSLSAREALRKTRKYPFQYRTYQGSFLSHRQVSLIRELSLRADVKLSDASYFVSVQAIAHHPATTYFEVLTDDALVAFAVAHEYFPGKPFLVLACSTPTAANSSDALYIRLVQHFREVGAQTLGLGYSLDTGLLHFKSKWGAASMGEPFHQAIWARQGTQLDAVECLHWACRILIQKALTQAVLPSQQQVL